MKDILQAIVENKQREVAKAKRLRPMEALMAACCLLPPSNRSAREALERSSGIIAEFKRRSPSKGWMGREAKVVEVVKGYERAGAALCSILTDREYFGGSLADLRAARRWVNLPLLRKDFIIDPYQLYEAKEAGADAVLLIAACLTREQCNNLARLTHQLGMEVLLEVHSSTELAYVNSYVDLLGVNNRHLGTFHTDVEVSFRLAMEMKQTIGKMKRPPLLVSESGLSAPAIVSRLRQAGFRGFLMGELFMREPHPAQALAQFIGRLNKPFSSLLIKVCGMRDPRNVGAIEEMGVDLMGFIFYPKSPRYVGQNVPQTNTGRMKRVGVFVNEPTANIVALAQRHALDYVQLHGNESPDDCSRLRHEGIGVIKAFSVETARDLQQTELYHHRADLFLFDTRCNEFGGSGRRFDWEVLNNYHGPTPFLLSGGISPHTSPLLSAFVHPFLAGIDLNSGFETSPGVKDVDRLRRFLDS